MLALFEDSSVIERCPIMDHHESEYLSEESDLYTTYNSPASSCIDVAAEVEIARDLKNADFYEDCLTSLDADLSPDPMIWANLADLECSLNECRSRLSEGENSQSEDVCSGNIDDYWDRCNSWIKSTTAEVKPGQEICEMRQEILSKSKGNCQKRNFDKLSWKEMTSVQQQQTIEHLTNIVSSTMGLREQLDVIRIVNPQAVVGATDTEFEIDLELLNSEKLESIREYVRKHSIRTVENSKNATQSSVKKIKRKELSNHRNKAKTDKKQNALLTRMYKQLMKEKRSGLFNNEQIISLSKTSPSAVNEEENGNTSEEEDDMEIDILH